MVFLTLEIFLFLNIKYTRNTSYNHYQTHYNMTMCKFITFNYFISLIATTYSIYGVFGRLEKIELTSIQDAFYRVFGRIKIEVGDKIDILVFLDNTWRL